jgi:hypothetical protein
MEKKIEAVCFDYRGTVLDHNSDRELVAGMEEILSGLVERNIPMALVSRFPVDVLKERLGSLEKFFGENVYSGGGKGKLECVRKFAEKLGIGDLSRIAFVDDKPDNFVPVAEGSDAFVIGFAGSGKYSDAADVCLGKNIAYADSARTLKRMLFDRIQSG